MKKCVDSKKSENIYKCYNNIRKMSGINNANGILFINTLMAIKIIDELNLQKNDENYAKQCLEKYIELEGHLILI
jgi:hypothetical protein